ncbi:hypothetical protein [Mycobacterium lacus]|nr:hypothetical protein [Mycobacterium lacus]
MSRRNRQKRATKQKMRRGGANNRARFGFDTPHDGSIPLQLLVFALCSAAMCPEHDAERHAADLLDEFPTSAQDLDLAADTGYGWRSPGGVGGGLAAVRSS